MKKIRLLAIMLAIVSVVCICVGACNNEAPEYVITLTSGKSYTLEVGDVVDFTQYFTVKDRDGNLVAVTAEMLDLSKVDTTKPGSFSVTLTIGEIRKTVTFIVMPKGSGSGDPNNPDNPNNPNNPDDPDTPVTPNPSTPVDLDAVFAKYKDASKWNFAVTFTTNEDATYEDYYEYLGYNVLNSYTSDGTAYVDYLGYDASTDKYSFYYDNGNGTYDVFAEGTSDFEESFEYLYLIDLSALSNYTFTDAGSNRYDAVNANAAGNAVIAEYTGYTWTRLSVYVSNDKISKVEGIMSDGYSEVYTLSKQGSVSFTLPTVSSGGNTPSTPTEPTGTMEKQNYDPLTFDKENLQDKMLRTDGAIGLPSTGDFHALVIPVQFDGDTITKSQLDMLDKAFNGNSNDTGWESVQSYYQKASYGKLNLTFDIQDVYHAQHNSNYYATYRENYTQDGQQFTRTGEEVILTEALAHYEPLIDLTQYDFNGDDTIDAVYLIYSASVDYDEADFYWAYVTWYYGDQKYDGLDAYYYLFAGFDFMDESTSRDPGSGYDPISGLKINAATYIHETGHLLGLDDYYDYDTKSGCNEGLGGADMMDWTVGDQNVYSKIMLGWLEPTIVNDTTTLTIESSQASASAILIPLNFKNSYFCEYLLIDLYSAEGLNALHARQENSILYDGASYGVRIYHVSSSINKPYDNDYGSFTDYNNTSTNFALIKLVEADGEKKFASSRGYAAASDLWQAGAKLSEAFPTYMRNDGKQVNFDVIINSVSATSASITVTFK